MSVENATEVLVEVVCTSVEDCRIAEYAGAARLELCSCIELGGLTPSVGVFQEAKRWCRAPIYVLNRPRPGGFSYTWKELASMRVDVDLFRKLNAAGIVLGTLNDRGEVHDEACRYLIEAAGPMKRVFHRAFDLTPDPFAALDTLIELGFDRVLTGGHQACAIDGLPLIQQLIAYAENRIEIVPAGGIRSSNVREVLELSGAGQFHLGPYQAYRDPDTLKPMERLYGMHKVLDGTELSTVIQIAGRFMASSATNRKIASSETTRGTGSAPTVQTNDISEIA